MYWSLRRVDRSQQYPRLLRCGPRSVAALCRDHGCRDRVDHREPTVRSTSSKLNWFAKQIIMFPLEVEPNKRGGKSGEKELSILPHCTRRSCITGLAYQCKICTYLRGTSSSGVLLFSLDNWCGIILSTSHFTSIQFVVNHLYTTPVDYCQNCPPWSR